MLNHFTAELVHLCFVIERNIFLMAHSAHAAKGLKYSFHLAAHSHESTIKAHLHQLQVLQCAVFITLTPH